MSPGEYAKVWASVNKCEKNVKKCWFSWRIIRVLRVLVLVSYPGVPQETRKTLLGAEAPRSVFRVRWAPGVKVKIRTPGVPLGPRG